MKAWDVYDQDNPLCQDCLHMYFCEECMDYHCVNVINDRECEPMKMEDGERREDNV